jgi:hypothetical protein
METYIAIYARSNTNPTDKFRVAKNSEWLAYINGERTSYSYEEYDTMAGALEARDEANSHAEKAKAE